MNKLLKIYIRFTQSFIPKNLIEQPLEYARAQCIVNAAMCSCIAAPIFSLVYALLGDYNDSLALFISTVLLSLSPIVMKATKNRKIAQEYFITILYCLIVWLVYTSNGFKSPIILWLVCCPLAAMFLGGFIPAFRWLLFSLVTTSGFYFLNTIHWGFPTNPIIRLDILQFWSYILLNCIIILYISLFEIMKNEGFLKLEVAMTTIRELAIRDELTGLYNRRYLLQLLEEETKLNSRFQQPFCIAILDLDYFKKINDNYGHNAGDEVLKTFAHTLQTNIRNVDHCGRYGGEEFLVIIRYNEICETKVLAERILKAVQQLSFPTISLTLDLTLSIGISDYKKGEDIHKTIYRADQALYQAKSNGRNQVVYSTN
jgi:diguanylate cyclase (GGDEF)-like protein